MQNHEISSRVNFTKQRVRNNSSGLCHLLWPPWEELCLHIVQKFLKIIATTRNILYLNLWD